MSTSDEPAGRSTRSGPAPAAPSLRTGDAPSSAATLTEAVTGGRRGRRQRRDGAGNMLPGRARRRLGIERFIVRLVATGGIVGIGVALGAILTSSKVQGWIIGLVVAVVSVLLSALLWSSREL